MNIYKLPTFPEPSRPITRTGFEQATEKRAPWYQTDEKGMERHYALCPACVNPIQIIGLYTEGKPYGRHNNKAVSGIAALAPEELETCPLFLRRRPLHKNSRRPVESKTAAEILKRLVAEFEHIPWFLKKATGIHYSRGLIAKMLDSYIAERGWRYLGATLLNIPWIFAYMSDSQSLFGQRIIDPQIRRTILDHTPEAAFTEDNRLVNKENMNFSMFVCFIGHQSKRDNEQFQESMIMSISNHNQNIYRKKIIFDYDFYAKVLNKPFNDKNYQTLASEKLGMFLGG